jgi:iron complex outermembrane receptor protein
MTRWQPLVRPTYSATRGWTTDVWAPLEGRVVNGGVRLGF